MKETSNKFNYFIIFRCASRTSDYMDSRSYGRISYLDLKSLVTVHECILLSDLSQIENT